MRTVALAVAALGALASIALAAPASADASACATFQGSVNGTALPVNGTYCTP